MGNKKKLKVCNLYCGIGGNRKLWPNDEIEVTAVENNPKIAKIYQNFFPNDKVVVADAHKYLLDHYDEFDFIWASPPCPTHSRMRLILQFEQYQQKLPDMSLYGLIVWLKHFFKGKWVVENVISYYEPLIKPVISGNNYYWSNFSISNYKKENRGIIRTKDNKVISKRLNIDLSKYELDLRVEKRLLNNCVDPRLGLHVWDCAFKTRQETLKNV